MATTKERVAAVDGWFTLEGDPHLLGARCSQCGTYAFPRTALACPNPACHATADALETVAFGRRGTVWSFTVNRYAPPPPYVAPEPFVPYTIAAVELVDEKIVVLGLVEGDGDAGLSVGDPVELTTGTLYEDDDHEYVVWKWRRA